VDVERPRNFVGLFPRDFRAAFEFRNMTWFDEDVYEVLRGAGAALVMSDTGQDEPPPVVATASYGYARLCKEGYEPGGAGPALADLFVKELESEA